MEKRPSSVALSQEELFVLLGYLKAPSLMGLDGKILDQLPPSEARAVLKAAERCLVARGHLQPASDHRFTLLTEITGLLATCITPEVSVLVNHNRSEHLDEQLFIHHLRKMTVLHTLPLSGIHQFIALEKKNASLQVITSLMKLSDKNEFQGRAGEIFSSQIMVAREYAQKNRKEECVDILVKGGLKKEFAEKLAVTLMNPLSSTNVVMIRHGKNFNEGQGLNVLQGGNCIWLLRPQDYDSQERRPVEVTAVSSQQVLDALKQMINL